jgi:uncharacterized repeat protein (TIGR03803 family)
MDQRGKVTILHTFTGSRIEGKFPEGGLVQGTDGNLYDSTSQGGSGDNGTLYQITTSGVYTQLHSFPKSIAVQPMGAAAAQIGPTILATVRNCCRLEKSYRGSAADRIVALARQHGQYQMPEPETLGRDLGARSCLPEIGWRSPPRDP